VKLIEQVEVAELMMLRPQPPPEIVPVAVLVVLRLNRTIPTGPVGPAEVSVTTTVQVETWPTATADGTQETLLDVE
jgi:hypothetical protein